MDANYERNDAKRRFTVTARGSFDVDMVLAELGARPRDESTWHYGVLYDMRAVTGMPSVDDLRTLFLAQQDPVMRGKGPLAIVVTGEEQFSVACAYAVLLRAQREVDVFRSLDAADRWLTTHTRRRGRRVSNERGDALG